MDLAIRGGTVVTPEGERRADVLVDGSRILAVVEPGTPTTAQRTLDARGCLVLPGVVDAHVHFRAPGLTHKERWSAASAAAVAGGVTTVLDMPNVLPPTVGPEALAAKEDAIRGQSYCDYGFYVGWGRGGVPDPEAVAMAGALGFKVFLGETTASLDPPTDPELRAGWRRTARVGLRTMIHAEQTPPAGSRTAPGPWTLVAHGQSRPPETECAAVAHACRLAGEAHAPVAIAHVSTALALEELVRAREGGVDVRVEVCPHHLLLTEAEAVPLGTLGKVNPPLRDAVDRAALWEALRSGLVDEVGSDHAPHTTEEKQQADAWRAPSGFAGVQNTLVYLWGRGGLAPADWVRLLSEGPARSWGLWPRKGRIAAGADADLVLLRPEAPRQAVRQWSLHPDSPVLRLCRPAAEVVATLVGGQVVFADGAPSGPPRGRWVKG